MKKHNALKALMTLLSTNKTSVDAKVWIERPVLTLQKHETREAPGHISPCKPLPLLRANS